MSYSISGGPAPRTSRTGIPEAFREAQAVYPRARMWSAPSAAPHHGKHDHIKWSSATFSEVASERTAFANYLRNIGLSERRSYELAEHLGAVGPRIAIISGMRPEYIAVQHGVALSGGTLVPILPQSRAESVAAVLKDSGAELVIAENSEQVAKLFPANEGRHPADPFVSHSIRRVITFESEGIPWLGRDVRFIRFADALEQGRASPNSSFPKVAARDMAALIYTSGSTGAPKGVMLSHGNLLYVADAAAMLDLVRPGERLLAVLPPAHAYLFMATVAAAAHGAEICLPPVEAKTATRLSKGALQYLIKEGQANVVPLVPDLIEKIQREFMRQLELSRERSFKSAMTAEGPLRWAVKRLLDHSIATVHGESEPGLMRRIVEVAARAAGRRAGREIFGSELRYVVSGSARLHPSTSRFFAQVFGIPIVEGYGSTEMSAVATASRPDSIEPGTVGMPLPGTTITIDPTEGEAIVQGPGVAGGYWMDRKATAERFEFPRGKDAIFRSGDAVRTSASKRLIINGRMGKSGVFKLSNGEFVNPFALEQAIIHQCSREVDEVIVVGEFKPFCTALVVMSAACKREWSSKLSCPEASLATRAEVRDALLRSMSGLKHPDHDMAFLPHQKISAVVISNDPFPRTDGVHKVMRSRAIEQHQAQIEAVYSRSTGAAAAPAAVTRQEAVRVRQAQADDQPRIAQFFRDLNRADRFSRFYGLFLPDEVVQSQSTIGPTHKIIIAEAVSARGELELVAVANSNYDSPSDKSGNIAVVVLAPHRGLTLGPRLMQESLRALKSMGAEYLQCEYLAENRPVAKILLGFSKRGVLGPLEYTRDGEYVFARAKLGENL